MKRTHLILVLLLAGVVYWPRLGTWGFSYTEGHRVIPAWEMMDSGDYLVPRMFGRIYLRKPPGLAWAIVLSSKLFGQTELAARAVSAFSATLMAVLAFVFGSRWFGRPWGLFAGFAQVLTPLFWGYARSAEIESLHNLATQSAVLCLIDMLISEKDRSGAGVWFSASICACSIIVMGLAKGPAGVPCLVAAVLTACLLARSARPLLRPTLWVSVAIPVAVLTMIGLAISKAILATGQPAETQSISSFLWAWSDWPAILMLGPNTLIWGLPTTLILIFPFLPVAQAGELGGADRRAHVFGRAVALACLFSLGIYTLIGVHNPRYAMPAVTFVPVLVGYVLRGCESYFSASQRKLVGFLLFLRTPFVWPIFLLGGAVFWIGSMEPRRGHTSGRVPAVELARLLPNGSEVWANGVIEARPELLLYTRRAAAREGKKIDMRWKQNSLLHPPLPPAGGYLILLDDFELDHYRNAVLLDRLRPITTGKLHKYSFVLYQVVEPSSND